MKVGDLVRHKRSATTTGVVVVEMAQKIFDKERILINASQQPGFNMEKLREAWKNMAEFH